MHKSYTVNEPSLFNRECYFQTIKTYFGSFLKVCCLVVLFVLVLFWFCFGIVLYSFGFWENIFFSALFRTFAHPLNLFTFHTCYIIPYYTPSVIYYILNSFLRWLFILAVLLASGLPLDSETQGSFSLFLWLILSFVFWDMPHFMKILAFHLPCLEVKLC